MTEKNQFCKIGLLFSLLLKDYTNSQTIVNLTYPKRRDKQMLFVYRSYRHCSTSIRTTVAENQMCSVHPFLFSDEVPASLDSARHECVNLTLLLPIWRFGTSRFSIASMIFLETTYDISGNVVISRHCSMTISLLSLFYNVHVIFVVLYTY